MEYFEMRVKGNVRVHLVFFQVWHGGQFDFVTMVSSSWLVFSGLEDMSWWMSWPAPLW